MSLLGRARHRASERPRPRPAEPSRFERVEGAATLDAVREREDDETSGVAAGSHGRGGEMSSKATLGAEEGRGTHILGGHLMARVSVIGGARALFS